MPLPMEDFDVVIREVCCVADYEWRVGILCAGVSEERTLVDPYKSQEASSNDLRWLLESYATRDPYEKKRAAAATTSLMQYGRQLLSQLNGLTFRMAAFVLQQSLRTKALSIAILTESPTSLIHGLHWEVLETLACWDLNTKQSPASLAVRVQRLIPPNPSLSKAVQHTKPVKSTFNILLVVSRRYLEQDIDPHLGSATIMQILSELSVERQGRIRIDMVRPGTWAALEDHLAAKTEPGSADTYYDMVHFDTHGVIDSQKRACLRFLTKKTGRPLNVVGSKIAALLASYNVKAAVFNSCESACVNGSPDANLARICVEAGIHDVLAMSFRLPSSTARAFLAHFYRHFLNSKERNLGASAAIARSQLQASPARRARFHVSIEIPDYIVPVVYSDGITLVHQELSPHDLSEKELTRIVFWDQHRTRYRVAHGDFNFNKTNFFSTLRKNDLDAYARSPHADLIGRQNDILNLESKILLPPYSNVIVLTGLAGSGKSALCMFLCWWWMVTGFVELAFYLNCDPEYPGNLREDMMTNPVRIRDSTLKKIVTIDDLRSTRHLVVIDNLDYAFHPFSHRSGRYSANERRWIESFAEQMSGGKSILIVATRSKELIDFPMNAKICRYKLPELQPVSATEVASKMLGWMKLESRISDPAGAAYLELLLTQLQFNPLSIGTVLRSLRDHAQTFPTVQKLYERLWDACIPPLVDIHGCWKFVDRVEEQLGIASHYFWALFICWDSFREDWLECCFDSWSKKLKTSARITTETMNDLLTTGWLSVCTEHPACSTPGKRNIKIHALLSNALRWRVSEVFPSSTSGFAYGTRQKLARHLAFNKCRGRHWIALMGKEDPIRLGFTDVFDADLTIIHEYSNILTAAHGLSVAAPWRTDVEFAQIRISEMLQFLHNYAIANKGFRADRRRLLVIMEELANALLTHGPRRPPMRLMRAIGDLVYNVSSSYLQHDLPRATKLVNECLKRVNLVLDTFGERESANDIEFNKPWMVLLKAKLLLMSGCINICGDGNPRKALQHFRRVLDLEWESSAPRWLFKKYSCETTAWAAIAKISLEAPGSLPGDLLKGMHKHYREGLVQQVDLMNDAYVLSKDEAGKDLVTDPNRTQKKVIELASSSKRVLGGLEDDQGGVGQTPNPAFPSGASVTQLISATMDLSLTDAEREQKGIELQDSLIQKSRREGLPLEFVHLGMMALVESEYDDQRRMAGYINRMIEIDQMGGGKEGQNKARAGSRLVNAVPMIETSDVVAECIAMPSGAIRARWPRMEAVD